MHVGFQVTVTAVVYPALARVPAQQWGPAHDAHGRAIVPLVGLTYLAVAVTAVWALVVAPDDPWIWVAGAGAALAGLITALVAAPLHGALGRHRTDDMIRRLLLADRVRCLLALLALVGAWVAVLG